MTCQCAELCAEYGNCSLEHIGGLEGVQKLSDSPPPGVSERYRCPGCGQIWELWMVPVDGGKLPWIVKQGSLPGPLVPEIE